MRLLFDENLSHQLVRLLADIFPQSVPVRDVGLKSADDPVVWQYAKEKYLVIVSKDSDLHQRSFVLGHPPKLVWVRLGNCSTRDVERLLRRNLAARYFPRRCGGVVSFFVLAQVISGVITVNRLRNKSSRPGLPARPCSLLAALSIVFVLAVSTTFAFAQSPVRDYRRAHERQILAEFTQLLAIPNVASDRQNIRRNAEFLREMMQRRGLNPRLLETSSREPPPAVYGEWTTPGATHSIVLYAHYDGQPTDPKQWTGTLPWQPVWRSAPLESGGKIVTPADEGQPIDPEWRLYARSSSDDKAGVMAILTGLDALRAQGVKPSLNIKFLFEGEEEAGSPHLGEIISLNKELLAADAWIICDGPVHQSGRKQVVFGVRGDQNVDVTVYGAKRPLHSGHYGNWAPNPAMQLAQLLASMKDAAGRVLISGWYEGVEPLGEAEQRAIAEAPAYDDELRSQLGFAHAEGAGKSLLELINQPSLNINGISSGDVGALARNVIPTTATAVLDLRLVKGNDYRRQTQRLIDHIVKQGFHVIDHDPTDAERKQWALIAKVIARSGGYNAERTRMDLPVAVAVVAAVQSTSTQPIVRLPTAGGSLPLSIITDHLRTVTMTVPIANYDNNQHAENENLRLQNLWDGIETMAAVMTMKPEFSHR